MRFPRTTIICSSAISAIAIAACGGGDTSADQGVQPESMPQGSESVSLDPAEFSTESDNPYWPMSPGDRWVYRETARGEPALDVVVTVTERTNQIANGVEARVVRDVVSHNGEPV